MSNEVFSVKKEAKKNKQTNNSEKRKKRKICKNNTTTATKTETDNKTNTCSYRRCLVKISVLKNFTKFTGKHLCRSLFFNKVAGIRHRCFPVNFAKFVRTPFLQNTSGLLLLNKKETYFHQIDQNELAVHTQQTNACSKSAQPLGTGVKYGKIYKDTRTTSLSIYSSGVFIVNFKHMLHLLLVFYCCLRRGNILGSLQVNFNQKQSFADVLQNSYS